MFSTTFLGHQGWMVRGARACVLIDPLLQPTFGALHALGYQVFPPRVIDWATFPAVDAVLLSHEHDDHFDLPSLVLLDRAIPIYLSARSSRAGRGVLTDLGFTVRPWLPGVPIRVGDLEITGLAGDHVGTVTSDEWDTLPYLVRSVDGHGSLFSMVDLPLTDRHVAWAAERATRPGLVTWTNNALDWSHMTSYLDERTEGNQQAFVRMGVGHKLITTQWGPPAAMLMCAGGFSFHGDKAWLNHRVFCVDNEEVCAQLTRLYKKEKFVAAVPGQTFVMQAGKLKAIEADTPFLRATPREGWPSRRRADDGPAPDYEPATGERTLAPDQVAVLEAGLAMLAGAIVGGPLWRGLHSVLEPEGDGRRITFAFALRDGDRRRVYEYVSTDCAFVASADPDPEAHVVAGLECWASDLTAVLAGELAPIALSFARARLWNALAGRMSFAIFEELYRVSHPLRCPAVYTRLYARAAAAVAGTTPTVRAATPPA